MARRLPFFSSSERRGDGGGVAFWTTRPPWHGSGPAVPEMETSGMGMKTVVPWPYKRNSTAEKKHNTLGMMLKLNQVTPKYINTYTSYKLHQQL